MKENYIYKRYKNNLYNYGYLQDSLVSRVEANQMPVNSENGYIQIYLFTNRGQVPVEDAFVTVYARQGEVVPVLKFKSSSCPFTFELPVAHSLGTLIEGPEYYFTTYDITIEKEGYYAITVKNIRMFPGITSEFSYNLNKILPGLPDKQETIAIPSHPRDILK